MKHAQADEGGICIAETCKCSFKKRKSTLPLRVKKLCEGAIIPTRASEGDAGWDLYACFDREKPYIRDEDDIPFVKLAPGEKILIDTGCAVASKRGFYGRIAPRSSVAWKHIDVGAGVVDSSYRGEVKVLLFNLSKKRSLKIEHGHRIAQLIFTAYCTDELQEVDSFGDEEETERGAGGFGSTGK